MARTLNDFAVAVGKLGVHTRKRELRGRFREIRLALSDRLALSGWLTDESFESDL